MAVLAILLLVMAAVFVLLARPWIRALTHGTPVSIIQIVGMRLRGNPPSLLVDAYITLKRAEITITMGEVENAYIDAGNRISTSGDLVELLKRGAQAR